MANTTYSEKLRDPRWQRVRLKVFERDGWACTVCHDATTELHVHHDEYYREPWDCPRHKLRTVCSVCHKKEHEKTPEPENTVQPHEWKRYENDEIDGLTDDIVELQRQMKPDPHDMNNIALIMKIGWILERKLKLIEEYYG